MLEIHPSNRYLLMSIHTLRDLFFDQLRDLHSVESQLLEALPQLEQKATDPSLKQLFREHAEITMVQLERVGQIFEKYGEPLGEDQSKGMKGLLDGGDAHIAIATSSSVRDALIIAHTNRIEHYEIAGYGVAMAVAEALDLLEEADTLADSLKEEKEMDDAITRLAVGGLFRRGINERAAEVPVELEDQS